MDANQRWDVDEAVSYMKQLAKFKPIWIEEPTSPDDVLGELAINNWCIIIDIKLALPGPRQVIVKPE